MKYGIRYLLENIVRIGSTQTRKYFFKRAKKRMCSVSSQKEYLKYKEKARTLVHDRMRIYSQFYGFTPEKIFMRNQKTRWGSCSKKRNISINYRIFFLSEQQQDYVVIHELCHIQEFNHSKKFWALVEKACPEYKRIRTELRRQKIH
jgi:predicted metal-dependent hydrolase